MRVVVQLLSHNRSQDPIQARTYRGGFILDLLQEGDKIMKF